MMLPLRRVVYTTSLPFPASDGNSLAPDEAKTKGWTRGTRTFKHQSTIDSTAATNAAVGNASVDSQCTKRCKKKRKTVRRRSSSSAEQTQGKSSAAVKSSQQDDESKSKHKQDYLFEANGIHDIGGWWEEDCSLWMDHATEEIKGIFQRDKPPPTSLYDVTKIERWIKFRNGRVTSSNGESSF